VQVSKKLKLKKKEVDDVLGGEDAWKNVERTSGEF
jgi:DNA-directed RNA polymerase III subunit RPC11